MSVLFDAEFLYRATQRLTSFLLDGRAQAALLSIPVALSLFVFFDATRRGMNGFLWMAGVLFTGGVLFPLYLLHVWNPTVPVEDQTLHLPEFRSTWQIRAK